MKEPPPRLPIDDWDGQHVPLGASADINLAVGESYSGTVFKIPLHVRRGAAEGPVVFVTAALHGDEINGTGTIRSLIQDTNLQLLRGALILVPVLNLLGFERHSRYLPDRRDLNRCFPGLKTGSQASRLARVIFDQIVCRSDYGIDLHTAAVRRTNFPNVRANLANPRVRELAESFGSEFIVNGQGPKGSFRRAACAAGCPTIVIEGGEVWKIEPSIVASSLRGIRNVLSKLQMIDAPYDPPPFQVAIKKTKWVRAEHGGMLTFHISAGDLLEAGAPMATNTSLLGHEQYVIRAPFDSAVIGLTTLPFVGTGEPICHLGRLESGKKLQRLMKLAARDAEHQSLADDLATNIVKVEAATDDPAGGSNGSGN